MHRGPRSRSGVATPAQLHINKFDEFWLGLLMLCLLLGYLMTPTARCVEKKEIKPKIWFKQKTMVRSFHLENFENQKLFSLKPKKCVSVAQIHPELKVVFSRGYFHMLTETIYFHNQKWRYFFFL